MKVFVKCMHGIGDSLWARPFVRQLVNEGHELYLETPLPFIYGDLPVKFIKPTQTHRTQEKYLDQTTYSFVERPDYFDKRINFFYSHDEIKKHGIMTHMEQAFGYEPGSIQFEMDMPSNLPAHGLLLPKKLAKKLAIVRPVTHRKEWLCTSRSPKANYIAWCARILKDMGYYVISVADCVEGEEWIEDGGEPPADLKLHNGELGLEKTFSLFESAELVITGDGFAVPAAIAAKTNVFVIFGGRGKYSNPHKLFDLRMNMKKIGWALPDNFCRCASMEHDCDKEIANLDSQFFNFMRTI